jgi:hypothetical protein
MGGGGYGFGTKDTRFSCNISGKSDMSSIYGRMCQHGEIWDVGTKGIQILKSLFFTSILFRVRWVSRELAVGGRPRRALQKADSRTDKKRFSDEWN